MSLESNVAQLTQATTSLLSAVNAASGTIDARVGQVTEQANFAEGHAASAEGFAEAAEAAQLDIQTNWSDKLATASAAADTATEQAGIATTQAGIATDAAEEASGLVGAIVRRVDTVAALRALSNPATVNSAQTLGCTSSGDGGGGLWRWDAASVSGDNVGTVILPTGHVGAGRWVRVYAQGYIKAAWFGASGSSSDSSAAVQAAINLAATGGSTSGATVILPSGTLKVGNLDIPTDSSASVSIRGSGGTILSPVGSATYILKYASALLPRVSFLENIRIDGRYLGSTLPGLVGIDALYQRTICMRNVSIRNCELGISFRSCLESRIDNVFVEKCTIGWHIFQPVSCSFTKCTADQCTVGWILGGSAGHANRYDVCLAQTCTLSGCSVIDSAQVCLDSWYFGDCGKSTSGADEQSFTLPVSAGDYSYDVIRSGLYVNGSPVQINNTEFTQGDISGIGPMRYMIRAKNYAEVTVNNSGGQGLAVQWVTLFDSDQTSSIKPLSMLSGFVSGQYIQNWPETLDFSYRTALHGVPVYKPSHEVPNFINGDDGAIIDSGDASESYVYDSIYGKSRAYSFTTTKGSLSLNREYVTVWPNNTIESGDYYVFSTLCRISRGGVKEIYVTAGGTGYTSATVTIEGTGTGASATAVITNGVITKITITEEGSAYTDTPSVTITGDGSGAIAQAFVGADVTFSPPATLSYTKTFRLGLSWSRIVLTGQNQNLNTFGYLVMWPDDTVGPSIYLSKYQAFKFARNIQFLRNLGLLRRVIAEGLVNTNGLNTLELSGSVVSDLAQLADGAGATVAITVSGASLGDYVIPSCNVSLSGMVVSAYVHTDNTVWVRIQNETGSPIDLSSATFRVRVIKQ